MALANDPAPSFGFRAHPARKCLGRAADDVIAAVGRAFADIGRMHCLEQFRVQARHDLATNAGRCDDADPVKGFETRLGFGDRRSAPLVMDQRGTDADG